MKRFVKLLSLGLLLTMASCSTSGRESSPSSSDSVVSSSMPEQETNGTILKRIADKMFDNMGADRSKVTLSMAKRALDPVEKNYRGPEALLPATYLYMTGIVSEIEGVDIFTKAFEFNGLYEAKFSFDHYIDETLGLTINVKMDRENDKIFFACKQDMEVPEMHLSMKDVYAFVDISYDFETNTLGDFKLYMDQIGTFYYYEMTKGVAYHIGTSIEATEKAALEETYNSYVTAFNTLNKVTATGATLRSAMEAYVSTQQYADKIINGNDSGTRIKESA